MRTKSASKMLIGLLVFLGIGAIGGGGVLVISPDGKMIGMPLSMLNKSPFDSFLIPGVILFSLFGIAPILLAWAIQKEIDSKFLERFNFFSNMHWSRTFIIYIAFALIGWIQIQMMFLNAISWLHTFYMFLAIALIFVTLLQQGENLHKK